MMHGLIAHTVGTFNSLEPDALEESLADINAALVQFNLTNSTSLATTWTLFEQDSDSNTVRLMYNPSIEPVPGLVHWCQIHPADEHLVAGIGNLGFYLVSQGGANPHPNYSGRGVAAGIGVSAARDAYRKSLKLLTPFSTFRSLRQAMIDSVFSQPLQKEISLAWSLAGVVESGSCSAINAPTPGIPAFLIIQKTSPPCDGHNDVDWAAVDGAAYYNLWTANNSSFAGQGLLYSGPARQTKISAGNKPSPKIWARVQACNGSTCGSYRHGNQPAEPGDACGGGGDPGLPPR